MKAFNASDMAHKRTEIFEAAKSDGAIIQKKNTNGEVLEEFVLMPKAMIDAIEELVDATNSLVETVNK